MNRIYNNQLINTFIPTILLWLLSYSTFFIKLEDFNDRFMGTVTALLVMTSLLGSINMTLPRTSYFKYIDLWFLWYLANIFSMIVYHILLDMDPSKSNQSKIQINTRPQNLPIEVNKVTTTIPLKKPNSTTQESSLRKKRTNRMAIIIFPIIFLSFNVIYFILTT